MGDALFNNDPNVFYAFEPLAPLYVAMYGLEVSSVIDTDLIFWPNGTVRYVHPSFAGTNVLWGYQYTTLKSTGDFKLLFSCSIPACKGALA